jgi:hypothetical protein
MAAAAGADVAKRIDWIESDLATRTAKPGQYDLTACTSTWPAPLKTWCADCRALDLHDDIVTVRAECHEPNLFFAAGPASHLRWLWEGKL